MKKIRCSTAIVQALEAAGADIVFGYNGHGNWALLDSFEYESGIKGVVCRGEDQAVHLADGYFRANPGSRIPVVTTSVGPGNMNIASALSNAFFESSAMVVLAGGGPTHWQDRGGIEEYYRYAPDEWIQTVKTYTKKALMVSRPDTAVDMVLRAYKEAVTGRPGPVVVQVPFDIQHSDAPAVDTDVVPRLVHVRSAGPDTGGIQEAAELIKRAERPLLFIGHGLHHSGAFAELATLAEEFGIPVGTTTMAKGVYPENKPLCLGAIGRSGVRSANRAAENCDLVIALGTHFSDIDTGGWSLFDIPGKTKLIHIDVDPTEISRVYPTDVALHSDPRLALLMLIEELRRAEVEGGRFADWRKTLDAWRAEWLVEAQQYLAATSPLLYGYVCQQVSGVVNEKFPGSSICVDTGHLLSFSPPFFETLQPNFQHCGFFHRMGWSLPAALGMKFARPDEPAIALIGDGSFVFSNSTLATAYEYDMPVVAIVMNNGTLQIERELMEKKYGRHAYVDYTKRGNGEPWGPDYCKIAEAMGASARKISSPEDLAPTVTEAVESGESWVIDVEIDSRAPGYRSVWYPYPGDFWKSRQELSGQF